MKRKFKMPKMLRFRRKKLRATPVRQPLRIGATAAEYGDLAEPNMKLSRALLIVLLLHVVAVAGIIAFNAIKTRQGSVSRVPAPVTNTVNPTVPSTIKPAPAASPAAIAQKGSAKLVMKEGGKVERAKQTEFAKAAK